MRYVFMKHVISPCYLTNRERTTAGAIIYKHNTKKQQQQEDENEDPKHSHNDINQKGNLEVADKILSSDFVLHNQLFLKNYAIALKEQRNMRLQ